MQAAQQQQPQTAPAQGMQPPGWPGMAAAMYQQAGMPTGSTPGAMGFGSMPTAMLNGSPMNGMLAMRMAPGIAGGRVGSPAAEGLVYSLPLQDARFHFSEAALHGNGAPTNDDLLTAFMPGCDDMGGGGSSGSAGLFGSAGIFAGLSSLGGPSTGGSSSQRVGTMTLRPSPLSKSSSGGSGGQAPGSNGGSGSNGATQPLPRARPSPPSNSVSSALPISALMFPSGSMHSDGSMPLGPMLRAPVLAPAVPGQPPQQQQTPAQQEQTSQRRPHEAGGPMLSVQQAQQDMQRFLNAEPARQVGSGTGTGAGASNHAAAAQPQQRSQPQSAFTGYNASAAKLQGSDQLQQQPVLAAQSSMQSQASMQQAWPMTPQQQWAAMQWGAGPQQQAMAMRQQQAVGVAFGQQGPMVQQPPGQQPQGPAMPGGHFAANIPQQASVPPPGSGQQTSGQLQSQPDQQQPGANPGQQTLPPGLSQQQQMAMLQWQQMQLQQMQAPFAMQQQAMASGQQMAFPAAPGMGPFGNPYMAQFPMSGGVWPPQMSGAQLMMLQQQAQQASMQQQAMQQAQAVQQQAQQQPPPAPQQQQQCASQPRSQGPPQQQQPPCCSPAAVQALLQPGLTSAHSSGTALQQQAQPQSQQAQPQSQQQQQQAPPTLQHAPSSCLQSSADPMSGVMPGAVRTVSNATNLTLSDAGVAHIKWEYGGSSAALQGNGSDPGSAGRSSGGVAVVPEMAAGGMRSGSAGSGQLGVPQVPASALLAGALMPPPYPAGGAPMTRAERVDRYREKKARRTDGGAVRYIARQQNAHRRPRIKGRFVKAEELAEYLASNPGVTITGANKLLGLPEDGDTYTSQTDVGEDSTAVALSAPAQQAHVVPTVSNVSNVICSSAPPAATA